MMPLHGKTGRGRVCTAMQVVDLDELKRNGALWQGRRSGLAPDSLLSSGWPVLDRLLGGGWPRAALIEVLSDAHQGLSLLLPLLARLSARPRWLVWVAPPHVPYAPALAAHGVRVGQLLLVRDVSAGQGLWAAEQALKSGACSAVLAWPAQLQTAQLRRLQLAAEQGDCVAILFRSVRTAAQGSPAALRLLVRPVPPGLQVEVLKRRGGWGGDSCIVPIGPEAMDDGLHSSGASSSSHES
ncbi:MAG: translesion DNA synthesis-associated protein ImuA [Gammaproteobacteria bacterium]|nr:translesion DNA synthesis-associated protein ImuA [Gammaproteobacteria bacterium]HOP17173.1 translesion DNA synthesis-associated protein ImuA [Gammaproteobacteria bacterium]